MKPGALLLAPGAGSDANNPTLVAVAEAVAPLPVRRFDFPYRLAGRKAPDRPPVLLAAVREAAVELVAEARIRPSQLVVGGRSMGGRMCSMAVAEGLPARGLVLLSYPLHPPGRPDRLRIEHFGALDLPCLFVSGTKDPFGSPAELEREAGAIPGPVSLVWIDGAGHETRSKVQQQLVADAVASWLSGLS